MKKETWLIGGMLAFVACIGLWSYVTADEGTETESSLNVDDAVSAKASGDIVEYESAQWEKEIDGVTSRIHSVSIDYDNSSVHVRMTIANNGQDSVTTYPDQGKLIIGKKQFDANIFASDNLGGEILSGVEKEGEVIFYVDVEDLEAVDEVRMVWTANFMQDHDVTLKLTP